MRRYESVSIEKLKPYKNNAKTHPEEQIKQIVKSIKEFGFINPVLIDGDYNIIAGHGRVLGAKRLGMDEVPCLFVEDLTDEQKRAYVLIDNKLTENGGWDERLLMSELESIDSIDMGDFGFDLMLDYDFDEPKEPEEEKVNERERTNSAYNLRLFDANYADGFFQMPIIENDNYIPKRLIGFNYAKSSEDKACGIHFYVDDYQFERIWNNPEDYVEILSEYDCILSPDFSLYMDMPMAMKVWNIYRSRMIGQYMQSQGIKVIPTISWAERATFEFCFDGVPEGSVVSISTVGVKRNEYAMEIWQNGVSAMLETIKPSAILVYGGKVDFDYGNVKVYYFNNEVTENMKKLTEN